MRRFALSASLLGLALLLCLLLFTKPIEITQETNLTSLQPNQKLSITGEVTSEQLTKYYRILILNNELKLYCEMPCKTHLNKKIEAEAYLERYQDKEKLIVLYIKESER